MGEFRLPSLGADMDEGKLLQWKVQPGDAVHRGQVVAVVDTAKAAVDVEIWQDGVIEQLLVQPGQTVPVGTVLATLRDPGEHAAPRPQAGREGAAERPEPAAAGMVQAQASPVRPVTGQATPADGAAPLPARAAVSPAARKRAQELGLDPAALQGSGPGGAVTLADVEAAATGRAGAGGERQQAMRAAIAAAMSRSKREIPHYYLSEDIPMEQALQWLQASNAQRPVTARVLPAALLLKAVALALARVPSLNGWYRDGRFEPAAAVHTGVAIALRGGGLVAPALHDVQTKPLAQLMQELADLVQRARAGSLRSSELGSATVTITNLGDLGVASVQGVIHPPQVALVGLGTIRTRPWVVEGQVRAVPLLTATLAADHRVSDGLQGAQFLVALRELLQQPAQLEEQAHGA